MVLNVTLGVNKGLINRIDYGQNYFTQSDFEQPNIMNGALTITMQEKSIVLI